MLACLLSRSGTRVEFQSITRLATSTPPYSSRHLSTTSYDAATNTLLIPSQLSTETAEVATNIAAIESTTGPIVSTVMSVIDSFHNLTGLPWWATIATVGFGIRTAMLPISLKGMKASAALFPLLQQARAEQDEERKATAAAKDINSTKPTLQNYTAIAHRFHEVRLQQGAPHPFWIIGSPLLQLPVFITAMASIRSMALQRWPGFDIGGTAWFPDLTAPALDFTTLTTPMGIAGVILPLTVAVAMYANIDAAFGSATTTSQNNKNSPSVMLYVMGKVRLALEWAVIPLFVTSLQLPHGAVCYWLTSSLYALGQNHTLRVAAVRQALGLGVKSPQKDLLLNQGITATPTTHAAVSGHISSSSLKRSNSNATKQASLSIDTNIPEDAAQGFARAAELRATGDFQGAAIALKSILETYPDQPRALFALGQVLSGLKDWGDASHAYLQAARFETEQGQECRAWFGAGVALHMSGREEDAVEAFTRAASPEADEKLRVRAWVAGATLEEKLGRRSQAVALLEQAAEIEPKVAEIYLKPLLEGKMDLLASFVPLPNTNLRPSNQFFLVVGDQKKPETDSSLVYRPTARTQPTMMLSSSIVCQAKPQSTAAKTSSSSTTRKAVKTSAAVLDRASGPTILNSEVVRMHTASKEALECIDSLQPMFGEEILPLLMPVDDIWQPQDFLPAPEKDSFMHELTDLRERAAELPDELLVCLVGDMITEEALPTYMAMLNTLDGVRDETGRSQDPYAQWTRQWIAEENRHGDLLNKYLWCTGRVDLRSVERTIQRLISSGMDPKTENNPYNCFVFTSFQERATKLSHGSTARIAKACGNDNLAKICGVIAQDESRHEAAYTRTMDAIFKKDPSRAMVAFADMMRKKIIMPAAFMDDGKHSELNGGRNLFDDFSMVAEDIGVYTAVDYVKIMEHLIRRWDVANVTGLNAEAMEAQEYLCNLPPRFRKLAERREKKKVAGSRLNVKFSWLYDRDISMPDFGSSKERLKRAAAPPSLVHG